jgi:NAD-dependent deacetylase
MALSIMAFSSIPPVRGRLVHRGWKKNEKEAFVQYMRKARDLSRRYRIPVVRNLFERFASHAIEPNGIFHFVFSGEFGYSACRHLGRSDLLSRGDGMIDRAGQEKITHVADLLRGANSAVVFTGAGVSTESGIPDFRSPGGFWTKFDPEDFTIDAFLSSPATRKRQWRFLLSGDLLRDAIPNAAHAAIAELEAMGRLDCVITQNIDNLHQKAGNDPARVFELHGNMHWIRCLECGERYRLEEILEKYHMADDPPGCERCGGIMKPDVIFFGEALPETTLRQAIRHASRCDLCIVVGSSLVVYPAASIPFAAKQAGAALVIINLTPTPADGIAEVVINAAAGEVMGRIVAEIRQGLPGCA